MAIKLKYGIIPKKIIRKLISLPRGEAEILLQRLRYKLHTEREKILGEAFNKKIITKEGYENSYKDMFYDEFGFDGFLQYIDGVMNAKADYFVTLNKNLIKRRDELESKFKLKIIAPEELEEIAKK